MIEFPGGGRVPQWRKELSERVREVQKRRALEAATQSLTSDRPKISRSPEAAALGLVPQRTAPAINPLVMKALLRIERAHHSPASTARGFSRGQAALAHLPEEIAEVEPLPEGFQLESTIVNSANQTIVTAPATERLQRDHGLIVVPPQTQAAGIEVGEPRKYRLIADGVELPALAYLENLPMAHVILETTRDDRASFAPRLTAALVDLTVAAFASCPFAAAIELAGGNWNDIRVKGLMAGIAIVVTFLYLTVSTALTGRTLGMRLFNIRAVDVRTGLLPSGAQSARRSIGYIFSLVTAGIGILYGLVDAEHRTAHDHFSGTIVVRD
ncbi:MAG: RDD family protein [Pyrinomonadaceae bacterium]